MTDEARFLTQLTAIFREELEQDDLTLSLDTQQSELASWDSLAHVRIVVAVERAFEVELDVSEIENIHSVRGFYDAVRRHGS
jgi:acyl carrier protein